MSNLMLVVDDLTKDLLGIENAICLYPSFKHEVPWSITIDEYYTLSRCLTLLIDDLAVYLTDLPMLKVRASRVALRKLIRANAAQILYIISDRLIRVLRLINHNEHSRISLIKTRNFSPPPTYAQLFPLARDSWEFSQYLVNEILADNERVDIPLKDVLFPENCWDISTWSNRHGFNYRPVVVSIADKAFTLLRNPFSVVISKSRDFFCSAIRKTSSYGRMMPIDAFGDNESFMWTRGFFWPLGKFCKLPQSIPNITNKGMFDSKLRDHLAEATKEYFAQKMHELVKEMGIKNIGSNKNLDSISRLFFQLFPINMLEDFDKYYNWSIKQLTGFKIRHYISWDTACSDKAIYYNCAATDLGFKVWGIQHSAWGGYLANVPRIAEVSIAGTDYYITSGWAHPEMHLPSWKFKAFPLSSPHYSEMKKNKTQFVIKNRSVLLATGEIFRFPPVFYTGSFYVEKLKKWSETIEELIKCLNEKDIHIVLKNYAPNVTEILNQYGVIDKWLKAGGDNISLNSSDEKGTAKTIFGKVSATIWDIPTGGFVESVLFDRPAFSLWNDDFIRYQPEAKFAVTGLINVGILNRNVTDMTRNVSECISQIDWWNEPERKQTVDYFMSNFIKTNAKWTSEWKEFLKELI